jgi:hypothetical protein
LIEAGAIDTIADFSDLELTSTESGGLLALGIRPQISWEALQLKSMR